MNRLIQPRTLVRSVDIYLIILLIFMKWFYMGTYFLWQTYFDKVSGEGKIIILSIKPPGNKNVRIVKIVRLPLWLQTAENNVVLTEVW